MSHITIKDFDRYLSTSESIHHQGVIAADEAFVAAMQRAIRRGREKATEGVTIDTSPPIGAKRLRGSFPMSLFGSPGAMCMEACVPQIGTVALMK